MQDGRRQDVGRGAPVAARRSGPTRQSPESYDATQPPAAAGWSIGRRPPSGMPIDQPVAPNRPSLRSTNLAHLCGEILAGVVLAPSRSEEHTSELQSIMRSTYADFCLNKKK